MSPAHIRTRIIAAGKRYDVRYRLGGRGYPILHGGTFRTLTEARTRRDLISGELAAGRDPRALLARLRTTRPRRTVATIANEWLVTRIDVTDSTKDTYADHIKRIIREIGDRDADLLTPADIRLWLAALELAPSSIRNYLGTLRMILDSADIDPNPARHRSVRLPRQPRQLVEPPSGADVTRILSFLGPRWQLPFRTLEQTGMRISELIGLEWRDIDVHGSRFRIRQGKTPSARRWVTVPEWLMAEIAVLCPPDDRVPERKVFTGFSRGSARNAMARACKAAGLPHYHPHDLRHRYASIQIKRGVPLTDLAAQLGHSRSSLTLDTYAHVMLNEDEA